MTPAQPGLLFRGVRVIDGTGHPPVTNQDVLVRGERIEMVGPAARLPRPALRWWRPRAAPCCPASSTCTPTCATAARPTGEVLPPEPAEVQLLRAARNAQVSLASGVTTVRDLGGTDRLTQILRDAVAQGIMVGPRIISCGRLITTTAGHGWHHGLRADTADELRKAARTLVEERVDVLKVMASGGGGTPGSNVAAAQYSVDELRVLVAEAAGSENPPRPTPSGPPASATP